MLLNMTLVLVYVLEFWQVLGYGALLYHVCLSNGNVAFSAGMGLVFW